MSKISIFIVMYFPEKIVNLLDSFFEMVFLTEMESVLLRLSNDAVVMVIDRLGNMIAMNKLGLALNEKERIELLSASADPSRTSDEVTLSEGQEWELSCEAVDRRKLIRAKPRVPIVSNNKPGERSPMHMLNSICSAVFDATVYLDAEFRLKSVSPQFKSLFSVPSCYLLLGSPFKDLITSEIDRERFEVYVESILAGDQDPCLSSASTSVSVSCASAPSAALMLEAVAGLEAPLNIRMYATGTTSEGRGEYFMGIQVTQEGGETLPLRGARKTVMVKPTIQTVETEGYLASLQKDNQTVTSLYGLDDDSASTLFEHPLSVMRASKPRAPPHISLVSIFYRVLNRDLVNMTNSAEIEQLCDESRFKGCPGWICPLFQITDFEAIREDVVKLLSNKKQEEFMQAELDVDLETCTRLMEDSTVGNLNVLSWSRLKIPEASAHHFCAISRFILSKLSLMKKEDLIPFYKKWMEGYEGLNVFCSSMRATIALSVLSCAIKRPEIFQTETSHLRTIFSNLVSTTDSFGVTDHVRLPAVYIACILWARLQLDQKREQETVQILKGAVADMGLYCVRHPGSQIIRLVLAMALFDLTSLAIARNNFQEANSSIMEMQQLILTTNKSLMKSTYTKISHWLNVLQSALDSSNIP